MKAIEGFSKEDYKKEKAPVILEFDTIEKAAEYLAKKYNQSVEQMIKCIKDDTNCDAIYFNDNTVILKELTE